MAAWDTSVPASELRLPPGISCANTSTATDGAAWQTAGACLCMAAAGKGARLEGPPQSQSQGPAG